MPTSEDLGLSPAVYLSGCCPAPLDLEPEVNDECKDILEEFCEQVMEATTRSDCLCDVVDGQMSQSMHEEYVRLLIKQIVDAGRCSNKAKVFYYPSCDALANASQNKMCCPEEGDVAFVHRTPSAAGQFAAGYDVYMLHDVEEVGVQDKICSTSVPYSSDCDNRFVWLVDSRFDDTDQFHTSLAVSSTGQIILSSDNGAPTLIGQITFPDAPADKLHVGLYDNGTITIPKTASFGTYFSTGAVLTVPKTGIYTISPSSSILYTGTIGVEDMYVLGGDVSVWINGTLRFARHMGYVGVNLCNAKAGISTGFTFRMGLVEGDNVELKVRLADCAHQPANDTVAYATVHIVSEQGVL